MDIEAAQRLVKDFDGYRPSKCTQAILRMQKLSSATENLSQLKACGIESVIDDCSAGHCSQRRLKRLYWNSLT